MKYIQLPQRGSVQEHLYTKAQEGFNGRVVKLPDGEAVVVRLDEPHALTDETIIVEKIGPETEQIADRTLRVVSKWSSVSNFKGELAARASVVRQEA